MIGIYCIRKPHSEQARAKMRYARAWQEAIKEDAWRKT